jgi:hypothetical protein
LLRKARGLEAAALMPDGAGVVEAVRSDAATVGAVKPKDLGEAIEEFIALRAPRTVAKQGRRPQTCPRLSQERCGVASGSEGGVSGAPSYRLDQGADRAPLGREEGRWAESAE